MLLFQGCSQHWQSGKQLEVVSVLTLQLTEVQKENDILEEYETVPQFTY